MTPDPVYLKLIHEPHAGPAGDYPRLLRDHRLMVGRGRRAHEWEPVERVQRIDLSMPVDEPGIATVWIVGEDGESRPVRFHWYEPATDDVSVVAEGYCLWLEGTPNSGPDREESAQAVLDRLRGKVPGGVTADV